MGWDGRHFHLLKVLTHFQTFKRKMWMFPTMFTCFVGLYQVEYKIPLGSCSNNRKCLLCGSQIPQIEAWDTQRAFGAFMRSFCICWCVFFQVSVASDPGRRGQHNTLSPFHSPFQSPFRSPMRSPFRSPFKNFGHPGGRTIDFDCEDDDMNLNCFILMFDLLLKQVAEAWDPFSSQVGHRRTPAEWSCLVGGSLCSYQHGHHHLRLLQTPWKSPKESKTTCVTICSVVDVWKWSWILEHCSGWIRMKELVTAVVGKIAVHFCCDKDNLGVFYELISEGNFKSWKGSDKENISL